MVESFLIKGFKKAHIWDNDPTCVAEIMVIVKEIDTFPDDETILDLIKEYKLDRCEVCKSYRA